MQFYDNNAEWPKHGESCISYGRSCKFLDNCTMPTAALLGTHKEEADALSIDSKAPYDIYITLEQIIDSQINLIEE